MFVDDITNNLNLNKANRHTGQTPLMIAIELGNVKIVKHLLNRLESINRNELFTALNAKSRHNAGRNALGLAVFQSVVSCATIKNQKKNIEIYVKQMSEDSGYKNKLEKIALLVNVMKKTGFDVNGQDDLGNTALIYGVKHVNCDIINLLVDGMNSHLNESKMNENDHGLNFGVINNKGNNALIEACLIGATGRIRSKNGRTIRNFANEKIQLLIEKDNNIKKNVNTVNNQKQTALSIVQKCALHKSVKLIKNQMSQQVGK